MFRKSRTQFSTERHLGWLDPGQTGARPALVLLHTGHGLWDSSVGRLIEEIERLEGDLVLTEARRQGSPSLEDARAAAAFLGARGSVTVEVPVSSRREGPPGADWNGVSRDAERVLAAYRRALRQLDENLEEAV